MSSHLLANLANALKNVDVSELLNDNLSRFIDAGMPEGIDAKTSLLNDAECQLRQNLEQLIR